MRDIRFFIVLLFVIIVGFPALGQQETGRVQWAINDNWKFKAGGYEFAMLEKTADANWERVSVPHTWNAADPFDNDGTYLRGICWYRRKLFFNEAQLHKKTYIYFEGANQVSDVYINGAFVGQHKGGYTAFAFDISSYLKPGENLLAVQVNNAQDNFIPPLSVGYAMYGGIYRDVWLVSANKLHFDMGNHAAGGVFISTPKVTAASASVKIRATVVNDDAESKTFEVINYLFNAGHQLKTTVHKSITVAANANATVELNSDEIKDPELWSPEHPNLYTVVSQITQNGKVIDEVTNPLGFRWFKFDPATGFSLNGKKYVLHGTNRHQDLQGKGSALTNEDHDRDMQIIKAMGCNFVRLAHYPQDPEVLRMADKLGLIIWEEIPIVNNMNIDAAFLENGKEMIREMVRQHYNHPSVMIWGSMNEVLLWSKGSERIQEHTDTQYVGQVRRYAIKLDSTVRAEDATRYSTMAMHWSNDYEKYRLSNISQLAGWNIYNGWYSGSADEFSGLLVEKHQKNPKEIIFISEYGAESDNRLNTENMVRLDFSGQYQRYYHETYLKQIQKLNFLAGTAIWNEFDFSQPNVGGTISHMNHKGMASWDRVPKDVYYLYKANWNPQPMVYIATRDWLHRNGGAGVPSTIDIYANGGKVTLTVNGKSYGSKTPDEIKKLTWKVALKDGDNEVTATAVINGRRVTDYVIIRYTVIDDKTGFDKNNTLFVNVGANTQYRDGAGNIWLADRPYRNGSFGYIGGKPDMLSIKSLITYTDDTPLFYSYQNNISQYRANLPAGNYEVELCFIEPEKMKPGNRIFKVAINHTEVIPELDLAAEDGCGVAVKKKLMVNVKDDQSLVIDFISVKGSPVLSGIKIKKLDCMALSWGTGQVR